MNDPTPNSSQSAQPTLFDLLQQWSAVQPDRCRPTESGGMEVDIGDRRWQQVFSPIQGIDAGLVQLAVQMATIVQNWEYECHVTGAGGGVAIKGVSQPRSPLTTLYPIERCWLFGAEPRGEAIARAALGAYLEVWRAIASAE